MSLKIKVNGDAVVVTTGVPKKTFNLLSKQAPDSIRPRYFSGQWICVPASNGGRAAGSKSE